MKTQSISNNNTNFGQLHAPRLLHLGREKVSNKVLFKNPDIKKCAELFDVYVQERKELGFHYHYLQGVKKGKDINFETSKLRFGRHFTDIEGLVEYIEAHITEYLMRIVAENYPKDGFFKSRDILNILETKEVKNNLRPFEVFNYNIEQNRNSTLLTKFFEINPNDDDPKDYDKVISILKSDPNINFNQKDNLGISIIENIFNYENEKALNLVKDYEFDYTKDLDNIFNNIQNEDFKKKAREIKIKFPNFRELWQENFSPESLAFLDSPLCDAKNTAVSIWLRYIGCSDDKSENAKSLFNILQKHLPEYYQNHYQRKYPPRSCAYRYSDSTNNRSFIAPTELKLADRTISSNVLLKNSEIRDCAEKYSIVVERGEKNTTRKKKVPRLFSFLPPKEVEETSYEYFLKGVKKGKTGNIETQKHLILVSEGIESYIKNLVNEIQEKDHARFIEIITRKHPNTKVFTAKEMLELLECDEIKGNYTMQEALTNKFDSGKQISSLLSKFFEIKETNENKADYDKLINIIKTIKTFNSHSTAYLEKVFQLENSKALDLFMDVEFACSEWLDDLYKNTVDDDFKSKAKKLKIKFPDAVQLLKQDRAWRPPMHQALSYLDSPFFCDPRKEAIRIWTELKTHLPLNECGELNTMLYEYLPENLRMD